MKKTKWIAVLLFALTTARAFAQDQLPSVEKMDRESVQKAIIVLMENGVIEWSDGKFKIKDESALDQLRRSGRVDLMSVANHVVCY